ncbi:MAG: SCO family protein [Rhodobacterales bacterium]|nr:MAG: SCO family protein [Rhodobacterales bacterium]
MRKIILAIIACVALVVFGFWYTGFFKGSEDIFAPCRTNQLALGAGKIGGPFTLVDETGKTVTDKDIITGPTLIYFGYTFCPDICPADNSRNAEAVEILEKQGKIVKPVFISIDPERDTPEAVADFTDMLHDRMIGLTGTPEQVKAASTAYHTFYRKQKDGDPEFYLVDHSTQAYLMFPEYGFIDFFQRPDTAEEVAERISCYMDIAY